MAASCAYGQGAAPHYRGQGYAYYSVGAGISSLASPAVQQIGFGGEGFLYKGFGVGAEAGYAHWGHGFAQAWIGSLDFSYHFRRWAPRGKLDPFMLYGFSVIGPTVKGGGRGAPAANFAGGFNLWLAKHAAFRFEVRDYIGTGDYIPGSTYLSFRMGVTYR
jgi:hypothetical protein